uniref:Calcium channel, voltage dependent, alpha2/delta subunit 3 n=1 Tax=Oncorhynchus kisutch TaxID=8019 RepID=A0A8C7C9M5_ONCKI
MLQPFGYWPNALTTRLPAAPYPVHKYKEFEKSVRVEEIDGMKVVKTLAKKMEEMFRMKKEAMRRLVEAAEEAHLQHEEDPELQYEYFNAVLINEVDEEGNNVELGGEFVLEPNDHFNNLSVNLSLSVVQVPTNMYNKDPAIVNGVYWSEALNKVFVDNFEKDPSLIWQYFGSAKGFFRQYPGVKWHPDEHGVIAFDCRNRKWYIQAATSPKDMVILVDVSGSMKGLRLTIARQTVSSILDTLGDDDFFNIIAYNQEMHYVEPCLNGTLVRADRNNKAVTCVFSLCAQAIMLVTDGATQMYDDVFAKFNWPDRKVRIFPYLIGRESAFADNMKWMACANKGYFSQISTLADVQENVMRYLHVMSRPKVIDHEHDTVWTEAYVDSTVSFIGPSLMTTVAMPVFSTKNETVSGILLGVVGTDIPLQELMKIIPKHLLGIHGYAFAITNNGYILTHPDLRPLYQEGQKRRKPNYSSVDLSEVEWEDKDDFLRNAMVNRKTGTFSMEVKKTVDKGDLVVFPGLNHSLSAVGDRELVQEVLFDAVVTAPLEAYWTGLALNKSENSDKGVEIAYLGTRTGLSRTSLFVVPEHLSNQDFLTAEDKEGVFNADHFPLWYKRANICASVFLFFTPGNENKSVVLASTAIQLLDDRKSPIVASVGIQMKLDFFQRKFWTASRQVDTHTHNIQCCETCFMDYSNHLFILLIRSSTGLFFGEVESAVMNKLLLMGSFKRITLYDYQALCRVYAGSSDSARSLSHVSTVPKYSQRSRGKTMMVPCDTEYPAFVSERTIKETTGNIDCEGCARSFVIQQIPSSNLFMVVVDNKCDCSSAPLSLKCDRLKFQKDRKRPETCHPFHPEENAMECGGTAGLSAPLTAALLPLLATLISR